MGLLPRVCAFVVPGQSKTHGYSGFENDVEDLVTDLPAAFVANDVPAAFCAPEVFVDAAMVASDSWVSMLGAALSAFEDAAMLCFQGLCGMMWNDDSGASYLMKNDGFLGRFRVLSGVLPDFMANSGSSLCGSPCGLMAWLSGAHLVAEMGGCGFGSSCCSMVPVFVVVMGGCCYRAGWCLGCCLVVAKARAAFVELFGMRIRHAAAAFVAAFQSDKHRHCSGGTRGTSV